MQHPEEGIIHAWLDGALPAAEAGAIEAHVSGCAECEARVAEARGLIAASSRIVSHLDVVPGGVIPATKVKRRSRWIFSAWPVAIAATLVIGISLSSIRGKETPVLPMPPATPGVIRPTVRDSIPVARPQRQVEPQRTSAADRSVTKPVAKEPQAELPPANAAMQKSSVSPAPPAAAPRPVDSRADRSLSEVVVTSVPPGRSLASAGGAAGMAAGAAGASATAPVAAAAADSRQARESLSRIDSVSAFAGCYESDGLATKAAATRAPQPTVIPGKGIERARIAPRGYAAEERYDRFALMDEAAPTPGQLAVRTLDPAGRPAETIYGAGWSVQGDRAVVRDSKGQVVVTLIRTDSGVRSAAYRVISCRK